MTRYISFGLLIVTIIFLSILFYQVMAGFLIPLFLAALLVVIFRPLHAWILKRLKGRQKTAAMLTTAAVLLLVLAPLAFLFVLAGAEARQVVKNVDANTMLDQVNQLRIDWGLEIPTDVLDVETNFENIIELNTTDEEVLGHKSELKLIREESLRLIKSFDESFDVNNLADPPLGNWPIYWDSIEKLKQYHGQLIEKNDAGELTADDPVLSFDGYRERLANTIKYFNTAKASQFGGKYKLWLMHRLNPSDETIASYNKTFVEFVKSKLVTLSTSIGSFLGHLVLGTVVMIISLYFFLLDGPAMIESFKGLSPLEDSHEEELVVEFGNVSRAVIVATLYRRLHKEF